MLQIISGRFFTSKCVNSTRQRTILYTNYRSFEPIETVAGSYLPASTWYDVADAVYEIEQCIEAERQDGSIENLVAPPPEYVANDFAALISFFLNITCSPDSALVHRLTQSTRPPVGLMTHPTHLIDRVFDPTIQCQRTDTAEFSAFVDNLVQLERFRFKEVMRAIRRYVVGLHRIGDDLSLAYALLVASIESLAQSFDQFEASWQDIDYKKRQKIDTALRGANPDTCDAVREAILDIEHVALARRYREFALEYLPTTYFREEAMGLEGPARALELPKALARAYDFRSKLVHRLEELPKFLTQFPLPRQDIVLIDGKPTLTFRGLARLARRVICRFVELSPKLEEEAFNYMDDLPNVGRVHMASEYWIWRRESYHPRTARRFLSAFLSQMESYILGAKKHVTDIRGVLEEIEHRAPELSPSKRLPMLALYLLYHRLAAKEFHRPNSDEFLKRYSSFDDPSIESLICHVVLDQPPSWEPEHLNDVLKAYFDQRLHKNGVTIPPILETAMTITVAEAFRAVGETGRALAILEGAVRNLPGHGSLMELEQKWQAKNFIQANWPELLLPKQKEGSRCERE